MTATLRLRLAALRLRLAGALSLALAGTAGDADAGGLARPISGSPTGAGLAGAFVAIADDASAMYTNPAGMGFAAPGVLASIDLVYAPRNYVCKESCPPDLEGVSQDAAALAPLPSAGVLFKPGGAGSSVTLGAGLWHGYGGSIAWDKFEDDSIAAINSSTNLSFELGVGAGWQVDDRVSLGAVIRLGLGVFAVDAIGTSNLEASAIGVGIGGAAGVLVRATDQLSLGLAWKSNLDITTSGSGTLSSSSIPPMDVDIEQVQRWPQSISLGAAYSPSRQLMFALQLDWTQWSRFESLDITFPGNEGLNANGHFELDWNDQFSIRAGGQYAISEKLVVRGGLLLDGNAVPDRTTERQYRDGNKIGLAAGASIDLSKRMVLDFGLNGTGGPTRSIPDNTAETQSWPEQRNRAPGEHSGLLFTLASGVRIAL